MYRIVEIGCFSSPRPNKKENEDFLLLPTYDFRKNVVFAVADGVGSLHGSSQASIAAITAISNILKDPDFSIEKAMFQAKDEINYLASRDKTYNQSATTLTLVQVGLDYIRIGHVGDCRAYFKMGGKLVQLTKDHTRYQEVIDSGIYTPQMIHAHKERLTSVITKAITQQHPLDFDIIELPTNDLVDDDNIIITLMSDGAYMHWHKRPRFATSTMNNPLAFVNNLHKRIEKNPSDDYTCLSVKLKKYDFSDNDLTTSNKCELED
ncbi:PP2C family protein-serine/threonine phosphatase [Aeromonas veronii]|uniref:PP2C family protein-serine/threonine phosphatase n=1 Tax=Aeromonas veronii TaxID=654 RepID=UPI001F3A7526|nr:protein phosphatase 2C domain-containing protein [Aeromonas veronii]